MKKGKLKPGLVKWEDRQRALWFLFGAAFVMGIWIASL